MGNWALIYEFKIKPENQSRKGIHIPTIQHYIACQLQSMIQECQNVSLNESYLTTLALGG